MTLFQRLESNYLKLLKSRTSKSAIYPDRFLVKEEWASWYKSYPAYRPVEFTAPIVLDLATEWADPDEISKVKHAYLSFHGEVKIDSNGRPLNPFGRTGITGRGLLGKWGANFAVDGLVTAFSDCGSELFFLAIKRSDTGEMATPGGYIENNDDIWTTRNREMKEEVSIDMTNLDGVEAEEIIDQGYIDDPRCTDNAWIETTVIHTHITADSKNKLKVEAGDDASSYAWLVVNTKNLEMLYANHALNVLKGVRRLLENDAIRKNEEWEKVMRSYYK